MGIREKQLVNVVQVLRKKHLILEKRNKQSGQVPLFLWNKYFFVHSVELERFSMGRHLLLEVYDVNHDLINDGIALEEVMLKGIERAGMTVLNVFQHCFIPQGCTIVIALSESHVSCHTWPEEGCLAIDVYTCGEGNPKLIALELLKYLNSDNYSLREVNR
jgi:S-adenosylmethionine decarboxylase